MNKSELIDVLSKKTKMSKKETNLFVSTFMETVKSSLKKGQKIVLVGFGTFQTYNRIATTGVNPKTKEKIDIPAKRVAKLKFSDAVIKSLNK